VGLHLGAQMKADAEEVLWGRKCLSRARLFSSFSQHSEQLASLSSTHDLFSHLFDQPLFVANGRRLGFGPMVYYHCRRARGTREISAPHETLITRQAFGAARQPAASSAWLHFVVSPQFDWHQIDPQRCFQIALHNLIYMRPMAPMCETW
jgi:hypothetical protein